MPENHFSNEAPLKQELPAEQQFTIPELEVSPAPIYSKKAIWGFSFLFSPIVGGILLRKNLVDTSRKKEGNMILLLSLAFTTAIIIAKINLDIKVSSLTFILNMIFSAVLAEYFHKKYFPVENHPYKKIWKPLLITLLIVLPILVASVLLS